MFKQVDGQEIELTPEEVAEWEAQQIAEANRPGSPMEVDVERDRRLATMSFDGAVFQSGPSSLGKIDSFGNKATAAVQGGSAAGDLLWFDPDNDFVWIAADNSLVPMDAPTMVEFANAASAWLHAHTLAARALKDSDPVPNDFAADSYWPEP